jgi:hypothetical protein
VLGSVEPGVPHLPFAFDELEMVRPLTPVCYALVQAIDPAEGRGNTRKFNIQLLSEAGSVLLNLRNLYVRAVKLEGALAG